MSATSPVETVPSETAQALARLALSLRLVDIPGPVLAHAKLVVRDTFGVMLAGSQLPEIRGLSRLAATFGAGRATVFGSGARAASHAAALVNGTGGVSLELDEGNQFAINHPAVHIMPALLALAEEIDASGAAFLEAFVTGYEVAVRVGRATKLRGPVHPFGSHAIVGTAVACARLLGFDEAMTARTIEIAAGLPIASSQMAANSGASVRNLYTGFTNHNGLLAARFAEAGLCGEPGALASVFGAVLGERFELAVEERFSEFYIARNYFKIYACSRWNHAPIEAAAEIRARPGFSAGAVETIEVFTYDPATRLGGNQVANAYAAKHSIAFNVAARLALGSNGAEVYTDEIVRSTAIQQLISKVKVVEDPALTALLPGMRAARLVIRLTDGTVHEARSDVPIGGFDNPLSPAQLEQKFRELAASAIETPAVEQLVAAVDGLEAAPSLRPLAALCSRDA